MLLFTIKKIGKFVALITIDIPIYMASLMMFSSYGRICTRVVMIQKAHIKNALLVISPVNRICITN